MIAGESILLALLAIAGIIHSNLTRRAHDRETFERTRRDYGRVK